MSTVQGGWRGYGIVKDGLVLYLDASSPNSYNSNFGLTTWKDISGNGNNGTLVNGPTFNSGNGGSIVFDGSNDYVSIPSFSFTEDFSVNFWEMLTFGTGNNQGVIGNVGAGDDINHYGGKVRLYNRTADSDAIVAITSVSLNIYYNYTFTRTGTSYKIYTNGVLDNLNTYPVFSWDVSAIGSGNAGYFRGKIPLIHLYSRALTAQEVLQNYNATKSRFGL